MAQYTINSDHATLVAIDQHARSCNLSALDLSTGEARRTRLSNCPAAADMAGWAAVWATPPYLFAYESGPCGFALQRDLAALGHDCEVIAVTSIARDGKDKLLKDDRRDADRLLAEMTNPASKARAVWVPNDATEALRDLTRAYCDALGASKRSRLQTSAFLLRRGHVWNERTKSGALKKVWTADYRKWLHSISFDDPRAQATFEYYVKTAEEDVERVKKLSPSSRRWATSPALGTGARCRRTSARADETRQRAETRKQRAHHEGGRHLGAQSGNRSHRQHSAIRRRAEGRPQGRPRGVAGGRGRGPEVQCEARRAV